VSAIKHRVFALSVITKSTAAQVVPISKSTVCQSISATVARRASASSLIAPAAPRPAAHGDLAYLADFLMRSKGLIRD
jgi:hypothetical protein